MSREFGVLLRQSRLHAGVGLRRFAEMIDLEPSNLSAIEHGRREPPADPGRLREMAETLGLVEGSDEWAAFFDAARRKDQLPADIQHVVQGRFVPALLRTIDNRQLTDEEIQDLVREIDARHGLGPARSR